MPDPEKSVAIDLERLDEQLLNIHVQLAKLGVLVSRAARNGEAGRHPNLVDCIRRHRDGMVECSRLIAQRIDAIGDIHKNCG